MKQRLHSVLATIFCAIAAFCVPALSQAADPVDSGNRYNLPRYYESEISAAEANRILSHKDHWGNYSEDDSRHGAKERHAGHRGAVLVDVRSIKEYVQVGHPYGAISVPYPHITTTDKSDPMYKAQTPKALYDAVAAAIPNRNTPIFTLCKTGHRSVLAANILANPGLYIPGYENKPKYTHVRNIWQGFEGRPKVDCNSPLPDGMCATYAGPLDLNNNGVIDDGDKDGWKNFQQLPYTHKLVPKLLYGPEFGTYYYYQHNP